MNKYAKGGNVTTTTAPVAKVGELLPEFNKKASFLQLYLNKVKENNKEIKRLKEKHMSATLAEQERSDRQLDYIYL